MLHVKSGTDKINYTGGYAELQNKFNSSLEIVENMPLGPEPLHCNKISGMVRRR